jgi:Na+-transporting NADH:ubiquinone oxidoreductase subunit A
MSKTITIKKGLNINLVGEAAKTITAVEAEMFAIKPSDFHGVFPKILVNEGDTVKAGTQLFFDKYRENIKFTSPVCGKITELRRGAKRVLLEIKIQADSTNDFVDFGKSDPNNLNREQIVERLLESGVWPMIRQRPYNVIANPDHNPKSIFISGFDSAPLAPDYNLIVEGQNTAFQAGIDALKKLTDGKIHLNLQADAAVSPVFTQCKNVEINHFNSLHPAGNVGVQINKLSPMTKGDILWHIRPSEVLTIGKLFLEGRFNAERIIALTGSEVIKPQYMKTKIGAMARNLSQNNVNSGKIRYISGNPLSGIKIDREGYLGYYDSQMTILPEGDYSEFFGWALPGFGKYSFSRTFLSWLGSGKKKYRLDTNIHGGHRAFVMTGQYEKVFPFDIYPMQLLKAIMAKNIDQMENLGIYEVVEEDFALCEFIDTSKTEMQAIVREGLDFLRKEMN